MKIEEKMKKYLKRYSNAIKDYDKYSDQFKRHYDYANYETYIDKKTGKVKVIKDPKTGKPIVKRK